MTPREFQWEVDASQKRFIDASDQQVSLAWEIERVRVLSENAAHRKQSMPSLKALLHRPKRHQTAADMRKALMSLGFKAKPVVH